MKRLTGPPILGFLVISCCCLAVFELGAQNQEPDPLSDAVLKRVASLYYSQVGMADTERQELGERSHRSMWAETMPTPSFADGHVSDRSGIRIEGAEVTIETESTDEVLGEGTTDVDGYFKISLKHQSYRGLTLVVTKPGYVRWAQTGIYGGIVGYQSRLDREIDESFLASMADPENPEERVWGLLEIIGPRQFGLDVENIYPALGSLRPELLQVIRSGLFMTSDDRDTSPADRARRFLEFWHDPRDESLFEVPQAPDISGQTIQEVCGKYADHHFKQEQVKNRTFSSFSEPILGPEKAHALTTFSVRYAHWGYSQRLVLVHDRQRWRLAMVQDYEHWHR